MKKIAHISTEFFGIRKAGGLADYMKGLTYELAEDYDQYVVIPDQHDFVFQEFDSPYTLIVSYKGIFFNFLVYKKNIFPNLDLYILSHPSIFPKSTAKFAYRPKDQMAPFIWAKAATQLIRSFEVNLILTHDWQCAGVYGYQGFRDINCKKVHVIHNHGYQGQWLAGSSYDSEFDGNQSNGNQAPSSNRLAIERADRVITVSKRYLQELLQEKSITPSCEDLAKHSYKTDGFLNGIDSKDWSPVTSPFLKSQYDGKQLSVKKMLKNTLMKKLGWPEDKLLILYQSRLTEEKGVLKLFDEIDGLSKLNIGIIFHSSVASASTRIKFALVQLMETYPDLIRLIDQYNEDTAHELLGASDIMLLPSLHEPCGLVVYYALNFGTIPLVNGRGGPGEIINDVEDTNANGFKFFYDQPDPILNSIKKALGIFHEQPEKWLIMQQFGMEQDFSWKKMIRPYRELFKELTSEKT